MGLQCMTLLILKQLHNAPYKVSGMDHGSSYYSCWFCFCCLCSFRSFVKVSLKVVALCRSTTSANASGKVVVDSCEWYMFASLCNLALRIGEIRHPSGA